MYVSAWGNQLSGLGIYSGGSGGGGGSVTTMDPIVVDSSGQSQGSGSGGGGGGGGGFYSPEAINTYASTTSRILSDIFGAIRGGRASAAPPPAAVGTGALLPVIAIIGIGIGAVVIAKALKKKAA